jgi:hypothetical protein
VPENLRISYCSFPSAISKLVGDLNNGNLDEDLYCIKTDVDSTIVGSPELDKLAQLALPLCWSHGGDRQRPLPVPHHRWLPVEGRCKGLFSWTPDLQLIYKASSSFFFIVFKICIQTRKQTSKQIFTLKNDTLAKLTTN